jgi:flavin-binding protein dodecin
MAGAAEQRRMEENGLPSRRRRSAPVVAVKRKPRLRQRGSPCRGTAIAFIAQSSRPLRSVHRPTAARALCILVTGADDDRSGISARACFLFVNDGRAFNVSEAGEKKPANVSDRANRATDERRMTMADHVYRIIQVAGSSAKSIEDAIQAAVGRASRTLRQVGWFEVVRLAAGLRCRRGLWRSGSICRPSLAPLTNCC